MAGRVHLAGRVGGAAKAYLLQNAAAVVVPSRGWEAFPLVVLEAFAAGAPVLASRIPGLDDRIADGVTGLLVDPESPPAWAAAVDRVRIDTAWRAAAGTAARREAAGYDWDAVARRHVDLYRRLARGGDPS